MPASPPTPDPLDVVADPAAEWFAKRTFHAARYTLADLAAQKSEQGVTVSVVLPTLDEGTTVGRVVRSVMDLGGILVDEIVVIDGGSSDGTTEAAAAAGARVHTDAGIFPHLGRALGKGDALWRSLSVTSGDIVVFIDTDIRNPDPRFVTGLLGPLLADDSIALVKAFYDRPLEVSGVLHPSGGGRVTELLVRPLINLLWPALRAVVQPLSGEYAGRRSLLEAIPFVTGYGVELGLLVDTVAHLGIDAIAQVDLERRVHRNQPIDQLGVMAFGILQAAARRMPGGAGDLDTAPLAAVYQQFERGADGQVAMRALRAVEVVERPPMSSMT